MASKESELAPILAYQCTNMFDIHEVISFYINEFKLE